MITNKDLLNFNDDIIKEILQYLEYISLKNLTITNKDVYTEYFDYLVKSKKQYINKFIPSHVIQILENYDYHKIKYLPFENHFLGNTGYIDRIKTHNLTSPIVFGIDLYERPFISFKINVDDNVIVHTLFQRYSNYKLKWVFGTNYHSYFLHKNTYPENEDLNNYKKLVERNQLTIEDYVINLHL